MDFDYTWKEPTEAQLAAWEYACDAMGIPEGEEREWAREHHHTNVLMDSQRRAMAVDADILHGPPHEITVYDLAEMMLLADSSLWYIQARRWKEERGCSYIKGNENLLQTGGGAICAIVDHGYQDGQWWNLEEVWSSPVIRALSVATVVEVCRIAKIAGARTTAITSAGFAYLPILILPKGISPRAAESLLGTEEGARVLVNELRAVYDPKYRKVWNEAKRNVKAKISKEYEPEECIHPDCSNPVAPRGIKPREGHFKNYRGTGACQRGHNSYLCTKCNKPHSFKSKVGQAHHEKFNGGDFTKEVADEWTASQ